MHIKERVTATPGIHCLLVLCAVSVVKANTIQAEPLQTVYMKGDKYFWATNDPFLVNQFDTFLLDCTFEKNDTTTSEK